MERCEISAVASQEKEYIYLSGKRFRFSLCRVSAIWKDRGNVLGGKTLI